MTVRKLLLTSVTAAAMAVPAVVLADSDLQIGGTGTQAQAQLPFRITIGDFVFFRVGTLGNGNVDRVDFDLATAGVESGSGGPFTANGGTGDGAYGALTVQLRSNATNIEIAASGGNLVGLNTAGNLPFADITAADGGTIPVPDFGATQNLNTGPYNLTDTWSYTYDNTNVYVPDEYNGTVIYTVTAL